jgi:hypothetical protein
MKKGASVNASPSLITLMWGARAPECGTNSTPMSCKGQARDTLALHPTFR